MRHPGIKAALCALALSGATNAFAWGGAGGASFNGTVSGALVVAPANSASCDSGTVTLDLSTATGHSSFSRQICGNVTYAFANASDGEAVDLTACHDATANTYSWSFTAASGYSMAYRYSGSLPALINTASHCQSIYFAVRGAAAYPASTFDQTRYVADTPPPAPVIAATAGQIAYYPSATAQVQGATIAGDCTFTAPATFTCTKTNAVAFAPSATTDTTNAANISSGTLSTGRLAANTALIGSIGAGGGTATAMAASANTVSCSQFSVQWPIAVGHIVLHLSAQDTTATDYYDIGIFSGTTLIANLGSAPNGVVLNQAVGVQSYAITQGTVTLAPGTYNLCYTGTAVTATIFMANGTVESVTNTSGASTNGTFTGYALTMGAAYVGAKQPNISLVP
jgi:hypothetical protein